MLFERRVQQYYEKAFSSSYYSIWNSSPDRLDSDDIAELAYYRLLGCFYNQDSQSIIDRRELLYNYLLGDFDVTKAESAINRYRTRMPINSLMNRVLDNVCTAYNTSPRRLFGEGNINDRMSKLYNDYNIDSIFQDLYKQSKLYGLIAIRPTWINEKLKIHTLTPDRFRVTTDANDFTKVLSINYPIYNAETENYDFHYWDAKEYRVYGKKQMISEPNIYGAIPFVFLRFGYSDNFFTAGMFENIEKQLYINKIKFLQMLGVTFQGSPIAIATNGAGKLHTITPDKTIEIENVTVDSGLMPPDLTFVNPESNYYQFEEFIGLLEKNMLKDNGLPLSAIEGGAVTSGISRVIERQELIEKRQSDITVLNDYERDFAELLILVTEKENRLIGNLGALQFSIDYDEERMYLEPDLEQANDYKRTQDGLLHPVNYIKKWGDFDNNINEAELIIEFAKRKELFNKLFSNNNSNDTLNNEVTDNENIVTENIDKQQNIIEEKVV